MHGDQEFDFKKVQESLAELKLDFGFFDRDDLARFPSRDAGANLNDSPKGDTGGCIASCVGPRLMMENEKDVKVVYSSFEEPLDAVAIHQIFATCGKGEVVPESSDLFGTVTNSICLWCSRVYRVHGRWKNR